MPDEQGMVSDDERRVWGILGKPPQELFAAPRFLRDEWNDLMRQAKQVMRIRDRDRRVTAAKEIERDRADLVRRIIAETADASTQG